MNTVAIPREIPPLKRTRLDRIIYTFPLAPLPDDPAAGRARDRVA